tara:strand:- start:692 stop:1564 length:873 start_codon:yes stop_codon:yes gene_type:complete
MNRKEWFKQQLKMIEIEVFSFCNRQCWFCPNSYIDRRTVNNIMPVDNYLNILNQLKEIDYDQEITYSRYNEPLSHREIITERISQARNILPNAKLRTNTNGDYVTKDYIEELRDCGLNELFIQQYLANDELYDHEKIKSKMLKKMNFLGLEYDVITDIPNHRIEYDIKISGITVHLRARNFSIEGTARTKKVLTFNDEYIRTQSCKQPFNNMYIDYNGSVVVCCNTRSDIPEHENGVMGNIQDQKLWDIYSSNRYDYWREHLKDDSPKSGICEKCKIDVNFNEFIEGGSQ